MLLMHLFLKILSGMANSVDPDQTAGSALFACVILSETLVFKFLGHLLYKDYSIDSLFFCININIKAFYSTEVSSF